MPRPFLDEDGAVIRFGGGRNTRASEDQINPLECADGENFILDPGNGEFRPRDAFDLVGTAPNGAAVRGFVTLRKTNGEVSMLVQAGAQVYKWDGLTFTAVGSVDSSAKIRGMEQAFWALGDKVLIADINLSEVVHEWDGTTFSQTTFLQSDEVTPFGSFRARYIAIDNERAFYGNIYESGQAFPHLLVCSKGSNYLVVSASDRPSSSLGTDAPWFLPTPQLKPINGLASAFNILAISQDDGDFEKLIGANSTDFALDKLHPNSSAVGLEAVVSTNNDIVYGAPSHIESLVSTEKFGDVEFDDLSFKIADDVKSYTDWTLVYNPRVRRVYCFPAAGQEVHVLHTDFIGSDLSPWSKWTTDNAFSFQPTATMLCRDPVDGLQYVFMGDAEGNVYRLEGTGTGDGGSTDIDTWRRSLLFQAKLDAKAHSFRGWLQHRKRESVDVVMKTLYNGEHVRDETQTITLEAVEYDTPYGGEVYYGGDSYYGPREENRLVRKTFGIPGHANSFQVETRVVTSNDFAIQEIGIRYDEVS